MWQRVTKMIYGLSQSLQAIRPRIPLTKSPLRGSNPASKDRAEAVPEELDQVLNTVTAKPSAKSKQGTKPQIPLKQRRKPLTKDDAEHIEKDGPL